MAKKMLIDATHAEETRVVVVDGNKVEEFDFESENKRQLAGNIYLANVTRVEPSLQAAFIDYGGNRHGFLAFSEVHPDYYQIPVADREALLAEDLAYAKAQAEEDEERRTKSTRSRGRSRSRSRTKAEDSVSDDAVVVKEASISGMDVVDLGDPHGDADSDATVDGGSPAGLGLDDAPQDMPATGKDEATSKDGSTSKDGATADAQAQPSASDADAAPEDYTRASADAAEKDQSIKSVADDDVTEDIRRPRKQTRKYKIQEVIKVRQVLLVQVVKEERGNKGAALTTYLSLAGRYCVLMPNTARGGGISRKITNAADRKKLKDIAGGIEVAEGAGLIIRTAGAQRTKTEIKRDYEYLQRMWEQIRELTLKSIAPAKIYEEGDLIKRSIRDLYNKEIDEVFVEGEAGYRVAKDFMKMIMPSHAKNVKLYAEALPLFAHYQVESYLGSMFNPTVQLKSGGYIVIGVTEALVAIDVNSGRATKEGSVEETALKTNLEAAEEVARQLRLRDLAGLIVIDYIDMGERRNNSAVEKRFNDRLKSDRARIQVGRISGFGLMEMSRQRLRPGMLEATTQPCNHCHGTGLIRSDDNLSLSILRQLEEEGVRKRSREVLVKAPVGIVNFLVNQKREHIARIEARYGLSVRIEADPFLISPDYSIEKFKTAIRMVAETGAPVVSADASLMPDADEEQEEPQTSPVVDEQSTQDAQAPKNRRRRRRRRRSSGQGSEAQTTQTRASTNGEDASETALSDASAAQLAAPDTQADDAAAPVAEAAAKTEAPVKSEAPVKKVTRSRTSKSKTAAKVADKPDLKTAATPAASGDTAQGEPVTGPKSTRASSKKSETVEPETSGDSVAAETAEKPKRATRSRSSASKSKRAAKAEKPQVEQEPSVVPSLAPAAEMADVVSAAGATASESVSANPAPSKPKKKGWWSLGK